MALADFCGIPQRWIFAIMGFLALLNAYTMRICLSVAIVKLVDPANKTEGVEGVYGGGFEWSEETQGVILSSFYWGYLITHLPGGVLADKFGGKWTLCLGILCTAIFTILTPLAIRLGGANALIAVRVFTGLGEGTTFPALSCLLAAWVPLRERSTLGALVLGGGQVGTIVGNTISGFLLHYYVWDITFYFFGVMGIAWFVFFIFMCYSDPASHPFITDKEKDFLMQELGSISRRTDLPPTPWKAIFTNAPMLALISAQIGHDWGFYIMVTDLPKYMADVMNFSIREAGSYSSLPPLFMWISTILSGILSDWLITNNKLSITNSRKMFTSIAAFGPAIFIVLASYAGQSKVLVVLYFTIAMCLMGAYYSGMKLNPLDFSPNYAGILMAITNGIGSVTGILAPYLVGVMTPNASLLEWRQVFWLAFIVLTSTCVVYIVWASGEIQPFNDPKNEDDKK